MEGRDGRREGEGVTLTWVDHPQIERDQGLKKPEEKKRKACKSKKEEGKASQGGWAEAGVLGTDPHPVGPGAQLLVRAQGAPEDLRLPLPCSRGRGRG